MRLTVVGCGDAFGSGGRGNTCYLVDTASTCLAMDFGATALVDMKRAGHDPRRLDAIVLSHLHGDHFGGIPFLLLDGQFGARRERPLTILGPPGTRARLAAAQEVLFPGTAALPWRFPVAIEEMPCGGRHALGDVTIESREVVHPSGAPATALRLESGGRRLAFSGDTSWTEALLDVSADADLFLVDCHDLGEDQAPHLDLPTLTAQRPRITARRIMLTHMSDAVLRRMDAVRASGFLVAHDGLVLDV